MAYTTSILLDAIARRSFMPSGEITFTEAEQLLMADEEMRCLLIPSILKVREEFYVYPKDHSIVAGTSEYDIPARSIGMRVREVKLISGNDVIDIPRIEPEQVQTTTQGTPNSFYLKNNKVVLYPTPSASGDTLRVYYFLRPGDFVTVDSAAVISAINTGTNVVSVTTIPSSWVTGNIFDFIKQDGSHEYVDIEYTSTLVSGTDITFASLPSTLAVGDYMALKGQSPLVQVPIDYQPILAQAVATQMLDSMSQPGASKAMEKTVKMLETAEGLLTPRVEGADRVYLHNWF